MTPHITIVGRDRDRIGESPVWDPALRRLFWVDSLGPTLKSLDPVTGGQAAIAAPHVLGSVVLGEPGALVVGAQHKVQRVNVASGTFTTLFTVKDLDAHERLNDGKTDRRGAFVTGTLFHRPDGPPDGKLLRLAAGHAPRVLDRGLEIANATCFSPSGDRLYYGDSLRMTIWRRPYDASSGEVGEREVFFDTSPLGSAPDGATVDASGRVWVALVQSGQIACIEADGTLATLIDLPVPFPSCPAFGGEDMDTLFVTAISDSGGRLKSDDSNAGRLLAIEGLGVRGIEETRCVL